MDPESQAANPFDSLHGTDTGKIAEPSSFSRLSLSELFITAYVPIPESGLMQALADLPFRAENFTFVDLGCGKGKALLIASQLPFRRIVGVEIVAQLCDVARSNAAIKPDWASRISVINDDATTVTLPEDPLVIFLYNPFYKPVLRRVLSNLERQLRSSPREFYLLYAQNRQNEKILKRSSFLAEVWDREYRLSPQDAITYRFTLAPDMHFTLYKADLTG